MIISRRCGKNKFSLTPQLLEKRGGGGGPTDGLLEHRECYLRKNIEKNSILCAVNIFEEKYRGMAGKWMKFNECDLNMYQEAIEQQLSHQKLNFYMFAGIWISFSLGVLFLRKELYKLDGKDKNHEDSHYYNRGGTRG